MGTSFARNSFVCSNISFFVRRFFSMCFFFDQKRRCSCCCPFLEPFNCFQSNICIWCYYKSEKYTRKKVFFLQYSHSILVSRTWQSSFLLDALAAVNNDCICYSRKWCFCESCTKRDPRSMQFWYCPASTMTCIVLSARNMHSLSCSSSFCFQGLFRFRFIIVTKDLFPAELKWVNFIRHVLCVVLAYSSPVVRRACLF